MLNFLYNWQRTTRHYTNQFEPMEFDDRCPLLIRRSPRISKLYRLKNINYKTSTMQRNPQRASFESQPNEILLHIFGMLPQVYLLELALVCKRFRNAAYDRSLWKTVKFSGKTLKPGTLGHLLRRGTQVLTIKNTQTDDPIIVCETDLEVYELRELYIKYCSDFNDGICPLLKRCPYLQKLVVDSEIEITEEICKAIGSARNLLMLEVCFSGISYSGIKSIVSGCRRLEYLDLRKLALCASEWMCLFTELPDTLRILDITSDVPLQEDHYRAVARSCPNVVHLKIKCTADPASDDYSPLTAFLESLDKLNTLTVRGFTRFPLHGLCRLRKLKVLFVDFTYGLDVFFSDLVAKVNFLEKHLPTLTIRTTHPFL